MMGKDLGDLSRLLRRKVKKIDKASSEAAKRVALRIVQTLAVTTPVDTSAALSNWQVEINGPVDDEIAPYFPGMLGSTRAGSARATVAEARRILKLKDPGEPIFISNVLPYIVDLNNGTSQQAQAGFVEAAVSAAARQARKEKLGI